MGQISEDKIRERRNEVLKMELFQAVRIIVNSTAIKRYIIDTNICHLKSDVDNDFHIIQEKLIEVISKVISNSR